MFEENDIYYIPGIYTIYIHIYIYYLPQYTGIYYDHLSCIQGERRVYLVGIMERNREKLMKREKGREREREKEITRKRERERRYKQGQYEGDDGEKNTER